MLRVSLQRETGTRHIARKALHRPFIAIEVIVELAHLACGFYLFTRIEEGS